jgi:hypothetical protein
MNFNQSETGAAEPFRESWLALLGIAYEPALVDAAVAVELNDVGVVSVAAALNV